MIQITTLDLIFIAFIILHLTTWYNIIKLKIELNKYNSVSDYLRGITTEDRNKYYGED